ncbi:MAG TPA: hypothetical protein VEQ85_11475, partial [Lacipirellulaceae bacterium]|nr:hypothetical protein [Lacipirellulaceae bacterium]
MGRAFRLLEAWNALCRREDAPAGRGAAPRRALAFERFEPRIALSAAVQSAFASDPVRAEPTTVLAPLWSATPGAANWPTATFSVVNPGAVAHPGGLVHTGAVPRRETLDQRGQGETIEVRFGAEGGLAAYNSLGAQPMDATMRVSQWVVTGAYGADANVGFEVGPPWPHQGLVEHLGLEFSGLNSVPFDGDATVLVGAADDSGTTPMAEGGRVSSPVLRIAAPLRQENHEGGAIDLMALVAPRAPFEAPRAGHSPGLSPLVGVPADSGFAHRDQT